MNLDVNQIKTEAKQITDRNLLAVIHLTNITPTRIGGYNAKPYSHELELAEGFRTSEVKGIWRWWLRTTLAGALWDLHGETDEKIVKEKTNQLLGSTESASKFALKVSVSSANTHKPDMNIIKNIPRLRMLTMKKGDAKHDEQLTIYPSESLKITISLYEQAVPLADTSSRRVAFGTLLLALLLQGMGAVTRRGFGHFQITLKNTKNDLDNYRKITEEINLANNVQQMQKAVDGFIEQVRKDAKEFLQQGSTVERSTAKPSVLPKFPVLSGNTDLFKLKLLAINEPRQYELLRKIGKATMKISWKLTLNLGQVTGAVLDSWVLGLPRYARDTGYRSNETERRPSAIAIAPLKKTQGGYLVALYGFLSSDWPIQTLKWKSKEKEYRVNTISEQKEIKNLLTKFEGNPRYQRIAECLRQRDENRLRSAFNLAFELVENCLK